MQKSVLKLTDDGSHTLYMQEMDECYHSTKGAIQESQHVFIHAGLMKCEKNEIRVLEIGFGTGLNALLTLLNSTDMRQGKHVKINYMAVELYPVPFEQAVALNYPELLPDASRDVRAVFEQMHAASWNETIEIDEHFALTKLKTDFTGTNFDALFDVIYFDAFSPEKQPEMWRENMFEKLYRHAAQGAVLTTYCAKGVVRRTIQAVGFTVERLPGPPGKREMLRAIKK